MKGEHYDVCNRTACDSKPAKYYNYSTKKYYCGPCASAINNFNREDALKLYGHELCVDIHQLIIIVLQLFPKFEGIEELDTKSEDDFSTFCHSMISGGIAMNIRNVFHLWDPECSYHKYFKKEFRINHPDEMSSVITKAVWRKHHGLL